jgi:hypothetical protein
VTATQNMHGKSSKRVIVSYRVHRAVKFFEHFEKSSPDGSLKIRLVKMAPPVKNSGANANGATGAQPRTNLDAELSVASAVGNAAGDVDAKDITKVDDRIPTFSRDGSYIPGRKRKGDNGGGGGATSTPAKRKGDDISATAADPKSGDQGRKEGCEVFQEGANPITPPSGRNQMYKELMYKFKSQADRHPEEREEINSMMSLVNGVLKETVKQATDESKKVVTKDLEYLRAQKNGHAL